MEVAPVDQSDIDVGVLEGTGRVESAEPAANDNNKRPHTFRLQPNSTGPLIANLAALVAQALACEVLECARVSE